MASEAKSYPAPPLTYALVTFAVSLAVYVPTLCPTIAGGDAGELVAEGCRLGTAHPPGYPLFTLITYALTQLARFPLGFDFNAAYKMNLFSAFCGSAQSAIVTHVVLLLLPSRTTVTTTTTTTESSGGSSVTVSTVAAVAAGLFSAVSPLSWQYHVTAEVFALNNCLVALITLALVKYSVEPDKDNWMYLGAFFCGLALTNQHTSILLQVPAILYIVFEGKLLLGNNLKKLFICAICFLLGFSPYASMPVLASFYPHRGSWGHVTTFKGLIHHFRRADYGTFQLYSGDASKAEGMERRISAYFTDFATVQGGKIICFFACAGVILSVCAYSRSLVAAAKKGKRRSRSEEEEQEHLSKASKATTLLVACLAFYLVIFHSLANLPLHNKLLFGIHQRFWMQPNIFMFIFSGIGMGKVVESLVQLSNKNDGGESGKTNGTAARGRNAETNATKIRSANSLLFAVCVGAILFKSFQRGRAKVDQSDNMYFNYYARSILENIPKDSLLLINYDQQWTSVRYLQECEGLRPDVVSVNLSMMTFQWWKHKKSLYDGVIDFPGTHYAKKGSVGHVRLGGFTHLDLLNSNIDKFSGGIYLGGKLNFDEKEHLEYYEPVPWGLTTRFLKRDWKETEGSIGNSVGVKDWIEKSGNAIHNISKVFVSLPDTVKYDMSTWEWTVQREYWDHNTEHASYLLEVLLSKAISSHISEDDKIEKLREVAIIYEHLIAGDAYARDRDYAVHKNLGLAYMHMVRRTGGALRQPSRSWFKK